MTTATHSLKSITKLKVFGKSDHAAIFLLPKYKQRILWEPPMKTVVKCWTDQSEAKLYDVLSDINWEMFLLTLLKSASSQM